VNEKEMRRKGKGIGKKSGRGWKESFGHILV
jgi:hypothetical protein